MKKLLILITLAIISFSFIHKKKIVPPGTVKINDTLFVDETEITNLSWREFENWTAEVYGKNSNEHLAMLPDTMIWQQKISYTEPSMEYYYWHPAFNNYPILGLSYEQTKTFCIWRTKRVIQILISKKDFSNLNFLYRLPTKVEWEFLAITSLDVFKNNGFNNKGCKQLNCELIPYKTNHVCKEKQCHSCNWTVTNVKSYSKNQFGIYNMIGNVAEMVNEKGICKGGSWKDSLENCRIGKDTPYQKPTAWLGFRCVCVVKPNF